MVKSFHLTISRIGENLYDGEAVSATLPGAEGIFTVLADHEAFVSSLAEGEMRFTDTEGKKHTLPVPATGIAEVSQNQATVLL